MRTRRAEGENIKFSRFMRAVDVCKSMTKTMEKYVASSGAELSLFNSFRNTAV